MSEHHIDLLADDEIEVVTPTLYSPRVLNKINVAITTQHFGMKRYAIDFNRYLSSIFQTHPDKYRYIHVTDVPVKQRLDDQTVLNGKVSLYLEYGEHGFVLITAVMTDYYFEPADPMEFVTFDMLRDITIESLEVDGVHTVVTGRKPVDYEAEASLNALTHVVVRDVPVNGKSQALIFALPTVDTSFVLKDQDHAQVELNNLRVSTIDDSNNTKIEIGLTLEATSIDRQLIVAGVKVISPIVYALDNDGNWIKTKQSETSFFGYVSEVFADDTVVAQVEMPENFELHPFVYREGMNHHPAYPGIWVPYNMWRMKDRYDIQLHDGSQHKYYFPNGGSFSRWTSEHDGPSRVEDSEVAMVRYVPEDEITEKYHFTGKDRLDRNIKMFGDALPEVIKLTDGTVKFKIRHRRQFRDDQIMVHGDPSEFFYGPGTFAGYGEPTLTEVMHVPFVVGDDLYKSALRYLKNLLKTKSYYGFALMQDPEHGYIGSLGEQNFADPEVDWVVRELIKVAQALPEKPVQKNVGGIGGVGHVAHVSGHNVGELVSLIDRKRRKGEGRHNLNTQPERPKRLTKADKKAAKKAKVKLMKAQREQQ